MALEYRIFAGDDSGGPVDFSSPVATLPEGSVGWSGPALAAGASKRYAIRVRDNVSGLEAPDTDAAVLLARGADGTDASLRPPAPSHLAARPGPGGEGEATVAWGYLAALLPEDPRAPIGFRAWVQADPGPIDYDLTPDLDVAWEPGRAAYVGVVTGLVPGSSYLVAVRAYNASGDDGGGATIELSLPAAPPAPPRAPAAAPAWT